MIPNSTELQKQALTPATKLYLALVPGKNIGWGVCSTNLVKELSRLYPCEVVPQDNLRHTCEHYLSGAVLHAIGDHHLKRVFLVKGTQNFGYTFFENVLPPNCEEIASFYDIVFAGSTWCKERLEEKGITWANTLIQGIDPSLFYPLPPKKEHKDKFIIFSGGKFEFRKGQDLVIRAIKVLQDRHKDVFLLTAWYNPWKFSMDTMAFSPFITLPSVTGNWDKVIAAVLATNGIDLNRVTILPQVNQTDLRNIYSITDLGLFPNRCEGGTNLVLMEYMACARPVIASFNTGHKDILTEDNAILLKKMKSLEIKDPSTGEVAALWEEPDLDEIVEALERAYQNREELNSYAAKAGQSMAKWTWERSAREFLSKSGLMGFMEK